MACAKGSKGASGKGGKKSSVSTKISTGKNIKGPTASKGTYK